MSKQKLPKLTSEMQEAGVVQILCMNYNKSFTCVIDLNLAKFEGLNDINPRKYCKEHGIEISSRYDVRCVRNPIFQYESLKKLLDVIDGRHTTIMLKARNERYITAEVHFGIKKGQAAAIFHDLAVNTKQIPVWDAHKCGLVAGFAVPVKIQMLLDKHGLTSPNTEGLDKREQADVKCYTPLREACNKDDEKLDKMFYILSSCFTNDEGRVFDDAKSGYFLQGMLHFVKHTKLSLREVVKKLSNSSGSVMQESLRLATSEGAKRAGAKHFRQAFNNKMK